MKMTPRDVRPGGGGEQDDEFEAEENAEKARREKWIKVEQRRRDATALMERQNEAD
jgi:hypothetical protein